jgi:hypothetical protein
MDAFANFDIALLHWAIYKRNLVSSQLIFQLGISSDTHGSAEQNQNWQNMDAFANFDIALVHWLSVRET